MAWGTQMRRSVSSFHCEKNRLIDKNRSVELWDGSILGKRHLLKFFLSPSRQAWPDFQEQSRLHNSIFLRPVLAGYLNRETFCHAMPADFQPETIPKETDLTAFVLQLLSFFAALERRGLTARWDLNHLVW